MWFLLAMIASGVVMDYFGTEQQKKLGRIGEDTEQSAIDAQLAMTRAKYEEETLMGMENLRKNLGSQLAIQAARGNASYAGSAIALQQDSMESASKDQSARDLNLLSNETLLKNARYMSTVNRLSAESQAKQGFWKNTFNAAGQAAMTASNASSGKKASISSMYGPEVTATGTNGSAYQQWKSYQNTSYSGIGGTTKVG